MYLGKNKRNKLSPTKTAINWNSRGRNDNVSDVLETQKAKMSLKPQQGFLLEYRKNYNMRIAKTDMQEHGYFRDECVTTGQEHIELNDNFWPPFGPGTITSKCLCLVLFFSELRVGDLGEPKLTPPHPWKHPCRCGGGVRKRGGGISKSCRGGPSKYSPPPPPHPLKNALWSPWINLCFPQDVISTNSSVRILSSVIWDPPRRANTKKYS